ncbi:MAG: hypothetical protein KatS3mg012_2322 [Gaiellaceae bacterium]|nr:MAG: hypothetical protein KatS3mg012_2322 [Gaiellaceae bacterium]
MRVGGRVLASRPVRGRRFALRVDLPVGDLTLRVVTIGAGGRRSSAIVRDVFGLPAAARPRRVAERNDPELAAELRALVDGQSGAAAFFVQNLVSGRGAASNAGARFPAASTLKLAIAATVLAAHRGVPSPRSAIGGLLDDLITVSDDRAANALLTWLGGSTSAGGHRVDALMRSIGLADSLMYGGYETRAVSGPIPVRAERRPSFGPGKYTTAADMAGLWRAIWLASGDRGPLRRAQPGLTPAEARHLLWLAAHVRDLPKLDRELRGLPGIAVVHKAGWNSSVRHDTGLVFWRGGVFVASVLTWGAATRAGDALAGRIAKAALARFRRSTR